MSEPWYALHTVSRTELRTAEALRKASFTVCVPTVMVDGRKGKRIIRRPAAFYPNYIFVQGRVPLPQEKDAIRDRSGNRMIIGVLAMGDTPYSFSDEEIGSILLRAFEQQTKQDRPPRAWKEGDICIISDGPGEGKEGKITKLKKNDAAFKIMGAAREVTVKLRNLKLKEAA